MLRQRRMLRNNFIDPKQFEVHFGTEKNNFESSGADCSVFHKEKEVGLFDIEELVFGKIWNSEQGFSEQSWVE
jgi:hypothetical protein